MLIVFSRLQKYQRLSAKANHGLESVEMCLCCSECVSILPPELLVLQREVMERSAPRVSAGLPAG